MAAAARRFPPTPLCLAPPRGAPVPPLVCVCVCVFTLSPAPKVRFLSNFYLAVYLTTFFSALWLGGAFPLGHGALGPGIRALALCSAVPVVVANMALEPLLSVRPPRYHHCCHRRYGRRREPP